MTTTYATTAELKAFLGLDPGDPDPANATRYIRTASGLVTEAILAAVYRVDENGVPTDATKAAACRDATLIQVEAWIASGIDPALGTAQVKRAVKTKAASNGGLSVTYDAPDPRHHQLAEARELVAEAVVPLRVNGLLTTAVQHVGAGNPDTFLTGTLYGAS